MQYYTIYNVAQPQITSDFASNWKYRQFLQSNATQVMKNNTMQAIRSSGNNPYAQNMPFNQPPSDLKQSYMKSRRIKSTMVAPTISLPK